ncbi:UNVERIFIED_CONTAM: Cytochrome c-type biogenesis protein CcmE, mitochondrial [Sesamum latifolium]|uniref:Cytochrome c-type biogenesis protein CcmE, mitochondrial n=1 Tax=Sesamum latifolium TaxID=2727402 RepID=A0AAW2XZE2_9LAMI
MASRFTSRLLRQLHRHHFSTVGAAALFPKPHPLNPCFFNPHQSPIYINPQLHPFSLRFLSTRPIRPGRPNKPDIGARARQLQTRRLWTYALTFSCIAGFIIIVLNQFQDQLVFYITPTDALQKYNSNLPNPSSASAVLSSRTVSPRFLHLQKSSS